MTDKMLTPEEYAKRVRQRLDRFLTFWEKGRLLDREYFPERLPEGEWDEQFWHMFEESAE